MNSVTELLRMRKFSSIVVSGMVPRMCPTAIEIGPPLLTINTLPVWCWRTWSSALVTPFTVENGQLTPTMKIKRRVVLEAHAGIVDGLHGKG